MPLAAAENSAPEGIQPGMHLGRVAWCLAGDELDGQAKEEKRKGSHVETSSLWLFKHNSKEWLHTRDACEIGKDSR